MLKVILEGYYIVLFVLLIVTARSLDYTLSSPVDRQRCDRV